MVNLYLTVIAGGSGTRFWPKSTAKRPKQLLSFGKTTGEKTATGTNSPSLLRQTLDRFDGLVPKNSDNRMVITTRHLKQAVLDECENVSIYAEPQGGNTAPCIYWGARLIAESNPSGVMLVMPADHYIAHPDKFIETVRSAVEWASVHDDLVTLGVRPSRPETGYGYLKVGPMLEPGSSSGAISCRRVEAFVEKPNLARAQEFLAQGDYLWNGGMFVWRAEVILRVFDDFMPEMRKTWDAVRGNVDLAYPGLTATSIDYGIMEKARNVVSFPLDCGWDDLGSWTSLEGIAEVIGANRDGNVVIGGDILGIEAKGNIVDAPDKLVAMLGVHDLIVVEQGGAILVADKKRAQDIKLIVDKLKTTRPDLV